MSASNREGRLPNRLIQAASPYLQQHARNPVDWYPWGEEALERARVEAKPIFLSIGYTACHWCHVMERESFENVDIAGYLNEHFVNIKVDREERPDLDEIYMAAVQMMTGSGGWPMSVFLTPERKPFYGGTYFPPDDRYGRPGFRRLIEALHLTWESRRGEVLANAERMTAAIQALSQVPEGNGLLLREIVDRGVQSLARSFDSVHGGFGGAPKFPHSMGVQLLLRGYERTADLRHLDMATVTLDRMAAGGIYDHLGGGFHRYSTDEQWLVPHFEKMLYDQALLALAYLEGFQVARNPHYAQVARETCDYVLRDLCDPEGGFYSSEDADSEGEEGLFYVWTGEELGQTLGPSEAEIFAAAYDVEARGNFEGRSILHPIRSIEELASRFARSEEAIAASLGEAKRRLLTARAKRVRPPRDEKVITSWNGLMIGALARAARVLDDPTYLHAAERASDFLWSGVTVGDALHRVWRSGQVSQPAYLDDYANLIYGLVELYEAGFEVERLRQAERLADRMIAEFADSSGGFFQSGARHGPLIARLNSAQDGSVPSGNSMASYGLLKLGRLLGRDDLESRAESTLRHFQTNLERAPAAFHQMLLALDLYLGPRQEIVIVGPRGAEATEALLAVTRRRLLPRAVRSLCNERGSAGGLPAPVALGGVGVLPGRPDLPLHEGKTMIEGTPAAYVCENMTCEAPVTTPEALDAALRTR